MSSRCRPARLCGQTKMFGGHPIHATHDGSFPPFGSRLARQPCVTTRHAVSICWLRSAIGLYRQAADPVSRAPPPLELLAGKPRRWNSLDGDKQYKTRYREHTEEVSENEERGVS